MEVMTYQWCGLEHASHETLELQKASDGSVHVHAQIALDGEHLLYTLVCDAKWCLRRFSLASNAGSLELVCDGHGQWLCSGDIRHDLSPAVDVDFILTPFTNTLPIRRLNLAIGESADIVTAYISYPELVVTTDAQRYKRTGQNTYLFHALESGYRCEISVDDEGIVMEYPGLFSRV